MKRTRYRRISGPLQTERLPDGRRKLLRDFVYEVDGVRDTVPAGFVTDYSSVPWFGRFLMRWSKVDVAGVAHDWHYYSGKGTRREADRVWRVIAAHGEGAPGPVRARIGHVVLRVGGWYAWRKHRRARP